MVTSLFGGLRVPASSESGPRAGWVGEKAQIGSDAGLAMRLIAAMSLVESRLYVRRVRLELRPLGFSDRAVYNAFGSLYRNGMLHRVTRGVYEARR